MSGLFDVESYAKNFAGRGRIRRLLFIAQHSQVHARDAYRLAVEQLKSMHDLDLYRSICAAARDRFPNDPDFVVDPSVVAQMERWTEGMRRTIDRAVFGTMDHDFLLKRAEFYLDIGDLTGAHRWYSKVLEESPSDLLILRCNAQLVLISIEANLTSSLIRLANDSVAAFRRLLDKDPTAVKSSALPHQPVSDSPINNNSGTNDYDNSAVGGGGLGGVYSSSFPNSYPIVGNSVPTNSFANNASVTNGSGRGSVSGNGPLARTGGLNSGPTAGTTPPLWVPRRYQSEPLQRHHNRVQGIVGLENLLQREFRSAALAFLNMAGLFSSVESASAPFAGLVVGEDDCIMPSEIAAIGTLCALATFSRDELKSMVSENVVFQELLQLVPPIQNMFRAFMSANYGSMLSWLNDSIIPDASLDVYLHPIINDLVSEIRRRALIQLTSPFISVRIETLAKAFHTDVPSMQKELVDLILQGIIHARIDAHTKVLHARSDDIRQQHMSNVLKAGAKMHRRLFLSVLRMNVLSSGLSVINE